MKEWYLGIGALSLGGPQGKPLGSLYPPWHGGSWGGGGGGIRLSSKPTTISRRTQMYGTIAVREVNRIPRHVFAGLERGFF